jgi:hypothetical protein
MKDAAFVFVTLILLAFCAFIGWLIVPRGPSPQPTYEGKPYDPHMRVELFNRCLDALGATTEKADTYVRACDLHAQQMAAELYAANGGAP